MLDIDDAVIDKLVAIFGRDDGDTGGSDAGNAGGTSGNGGDGSESSCKSRKLREAQKAAARQCLSGTVLVRKPGLKQASK